MQPIICGMIESITLEIFLNGLKRFIAKREWIHQFMKQYMNWSFKMAITIINRLPPNWLNKASTLFITNLVKAYNIPLTLVVNSD